MADAVHEPGCEAAPIRMRTAPGLHWTLGTCLLLVVATVGCQGIIDSDPLAATEELPKSCGNGICNPKESCETCPSDCGECPATDDAGTGGEHDTGVDAGLDDGDAAPADEDAGPDSDETVVHAAPGELEAAVAEVRSLNAEGLASRLQLQAGAVYREALLLHGGGTDAPITIDGNDAILSGADSWSSDWTRVAPGTYTHRWPYDWGPKPNPWEDYGVSLPPELERREGLFISDVPYHVVVDHDDLAPGTFLVDEDADEITVKVLAEHDPLPAEVEVAVRRPVLEISDRRNVTVRNLTVEKGTGGVQESMAGTLRGGNITYEHVTWRHAGYAGVGSAYVEDLVYRDVRVVDNGVTGMGSFRGTNLVVEGVEMAGNNWRGVRVGWTGWDAGHKFAANHGIVARDVHSHDNYSHGFWLDWDNRDVVIERLTSVDNLGRGLYLEANPGPIDIRDSFICRNGTTGISFARSDHVTLEDSVIAWNAGWQNMHTGSPTPLTMSDGTVVGGYWLTMRNNTIVGDDTPFEHSLDKGWLFWNGGDEDEFWDTLEVSGNRWWHSERADAFKIEPEWWKSADHEQFAARVGETDGSWGDPGDVCP